MVTRCAALGLLLLGAVGSLPQKQDPCEAGFHYNESYGSCCYLCLSDLVPQKPCPQRLEDCRKKCDPDHYLEIEEESRCQACVNCSRGDLVEKIPCTWNSPRVCVCQEGMFCATSASHSCARCVKHSMCPPGTIVKEQGTLEEDTVCEPCLPGTFSNHSSTAKDCQPHTRISDLPDPSNTTANPSDRSSTHDIGTLSPSLTGRPNPGSESLFWVATVFAVTLAFVLLLICQQRACRKGILQKLHLPSGQAFQPKVMSMGYSLKKNCQQPQSLPRNAEISEKQGLMSSRPAVETNNRLTPFSKEPLGLDLNATENLGPGDIPESRATTEHTNNQIENIYIMKADTVIVGSVTRVSEGRNPVVTLGLEETALETDQSTHYPEQETELSPGGHIEVMFSVEEEGKEYHWPTAVSAK